MMFGPTGHRGLFLFGGLRSPHTLEGVLKAHPRRSGAVPPHPLELGCVPLPGPPNHKNQWYPVSLYIMD